MLIYIYILKYNIIYVDKIKEEGCYSKCTVSKMLKNRWVVSISWTKIGYLISKNEKRDNREER